MGLRQQAARAAREPLVQFLLAGAVIFAVFAWRGADTNLGARRIEVTEDRVDRLATRWAQTWQRPPTATELDGLIRDYVKEEVYYREALRLELDQDDPVIRRQLRSKMEFLATAELENAVPTEAELQKWLDSHPGLYGADPQFTFQQVYVGAGADSAKALRLLAQLKAGAAPEGLAERLSAPMTMTAATAMEADRVFGDEFAAALASLPVGQWAGPVTSGFGLHLVRVSKVAATGKPVLAQIRQSVENDWRAANRDQAEARAYQTLLDGYDVVIAPPK